jgi:hypothetical protein
MSLPFLSSNRTKSATSTTSSPSKRSYSRSSPTSSPDASRGGENTSPRVLRTKVSRLEDGSGEAIKPFELKLDDLKHPSIEMFEPQGDNVTPNTPPETMLEPLVGLGMAFEEGKDRGNEPVGEEKEQDGSTQTETAVRQQQELMAMSSERQVALARLCSQSWCVSSPCPFSPFPPPLILLSVLRGQVERIQHA